MVANSLYGAERRTKSLRQDCLRDEIGFARAEMWEEGKLVWCRATMRQVLKVIDILPA